MIIGPDFVFIAVPKTASQSLTYHWLPKYGGKDLGPEQYHRRDVPSEHAHKLTFAVVRNPYDRVVSFWHYMAKFLPEQVADLSPRFDPSWPLEEFCDWLPETQDERFFCQTKFLSLARVDRILRYEHLISDLRHLPFVHRWYELPHTNSTDRPPLSQDLTPRAIRSINQYCRDAFSSYGYQMQVS